MRIPKTDKGCKTEQIKIAYINFDFAESVVGAVLGDAELLEGKHHNFASARVLETNFNLSFYCKAIETGPFS